MFLILTVDRFYSSIAFVWMFLLLLVEAAGIASGLLAMLLSGVGYLVIGG